jgi:hypothetical protein
MVTKRQLGILIISIASLVLLGSFLVDWLGAGNFTGIGPFQRMALIGSGFGILVGLSLLPFGDRPA